MTSSTVKYSMHINTIEDLREYVKGSDMRASQIDRGDLNVNLFQVKIGKGILNSSNIDMSILSEGSFAPGVATLGMILDCRMPNTYNGLDVIAGDFGLFGSKYESIHLLTPNTRWVTIQIQLSDIEALCADLTKNLNTIYQQHDAVYLSFFSNIRSVVDNVLYCDEEVLSNLDGDMVYNYVVTEIAYMMSKNQKGVNPSLDNYLRTGLLISEYLHAYNTEAIQVADLCHITCKSIRTLERICLKVFRMSPGKLIKLHRLNAIRRVIVNSPPDEAISLTVLSMQYGFMNTGRFAGEYRRIFGERPSDTLAKARQ